MNNLLKSSKSQSILLIETIDLSKCRLCQKHEGRTVIQSKDILLDYIANCAKIYIKNDSRNEFLPKSICELCEIFLNEFYHFQKNCTAIDEQLKELLEESKSTPGIIVNEHNATSWLQKSDKISINSKNNPCDETELDVDLPDLDQIDSDSEELLETIEEPITNFLCTYNECKNSYPSKGALTRHRYKTHNLRDFLCKICGKSFGKSNILKDHEKIHSRPFKCTSCDKCFPQMFMLKKHIKLHHEGLRFYCPQCGKSFLTIPALKRHELTHSGIKDFKCEQCPLAFYTKQELSKHKQYHEGIRPHLCTVCHKTYVEKNHLITHMRTHTGERPYLCDVTDCTKAFSSSWRLTAHKKNVHHLIVAPKLRTVPRTGRTIS